MTPTRLDLRPLSPLSPRLAQRTQKWVTDVKERVRTFEEDSKVGQAIGRVRRESVEAGKAVGAAVRTERRVSGGLYIALLATAAFAALREAEWQVRYRRQWELNEFARWTNEMCSSENTWRSETILCQSVQGNWLARQLVRIKLAQADVDHCDRDTDADGGRRRRSWRRKEGKKEAVRAGCCRSQPCPSRGLSSLLFWLSRDDRSPINKRGYLTFLG
jgi:hypothetical protein